MMKFSAIVALVLFATADATSVTWGSVTPNNLVQGKTADSIAIAFTTDANLVAGNLITVTPSANIFAADGNTACTAVTTATVNPTFVGAAAAANKGVVSLSTGAQKITFTLASGGTDIVGASTLITITCTDNIKANAAAATAITFSVVTTADATALTTQTGYTTTAGFIDFTATRASRVAGAAPGNLVVTIKPKVLIAAGGGITLTPSTNIFDADSTTATTCTVVITGDATTAPTMTAAVSLTSTTANTQKVILTMAGNPTDTIEVDEVATITCTGNMAVVNGAAASTVKFAVATSGDTTGLTAVQAGGYTIAAASAASSTASVSMLTMLALAGVAMRQ